MDDPDIAVYDDNDDQPGDYADKVWTKSDAFAWAAGCGPVPPMPPPSPCSSWDEYRRKLGDEAGFWNVSGEGQRIIVYGGYAVDESKTDSDGHIWTTWDAVKWAYKIGPKPAVTPPEPFMGWRKLRKAINKPKIITVDLGAKPGIVWGCYEFLTNEPLSISRNQFGRQPSQPRPNQNQPPSRANTSSPSAYSPSSLVPPSLPAAPASPSGSGGTMQTNDQAYQSNQGTKKPPFFFRDEYTGFIVKGNFMTLAAKPEYVEGGEWMAHQVVEQFRFLDSLLKIIQTDSRSSGGSICNEQTCPAMTAGPNVVYHWMDTNRNPINLPATQYIKHIRTWVGTKSQDETLMPTATFQTAPNIPTPEQIANDPTYWLGKSSGFPQRFENEITLMYRQMFRCYAHLYWSHWLNYWDLSMHKELNTGFVHFVNVGRLFGILSDKDAEPMQPLIDLWIRQGHLPQIEKDDPLAIAPPATQGHAGSTPTSASASSAAQASTA